MVNLMLRISYHNQKEKKEKTEMRAQPIPYARGPVSPEGLEGCPPARGFQKPSTLLTQMTLVTSGLSVHVSLTET